jgi:single-stranded-DNA-specific exonuclease
LELVEVLLTHLGAKNPAAGMSMPSANFEEFCERVTELVESELTDESQLAGLLQADYELPLSRVNVETMAELAPLEPYGPGNARPLFVARNLRVLDYKVNGKDGRTLGMTLVPGDDPGARPVRAVAFGQAPEWAPRLADKPKIDIMFRLEADEWQGQQRVQLRVEGLRLSKA